MKALSKLLVVILASSLLTGCGVLMGWMMSGPSGHAKLIDYGDKIKIRNDRAYALVRVGYAKDIKEPRRWANFYSLDPATKTFIKGSCGPKEWFEGEVPQDETDKYFLFEVIPETYAFVPFPGHIDGFDESTGAYFDLKPGEISYLGDFMNFKNSSITLEYDMNTAKNFFQSHWKSNYTIKKTEKVLDKIQDPMQILCY